MSKLRCFIVVAFLTTAGAVVGLFLPLLLRALGCRTFQWEGHTVVIFNKRLRDVWGSNTVASYTAVGKGWFHFRSMRAFKNVYFRRHEWRHREQHREDWLFPVKYLWAARTCEYRHNPYEVDAHNAERRRSPVDTIK